MITRRQSLTLMTAALIMPAGLTRANTTLAQGSFSGLNNHVTTGTGYIVEKDGKMYITLGDDFNFDGAPDPRPALGKDGYAPETLTRLLYSNTGAQSFELPAGIDVSAYNEIWIWCEQFSVGLGVAKLN